MPEFDERGLLGLAFHPQYATNGRVLRLLQRAAARGRARPGFDHTSHISEFRVSAADPNRADPASERILLQVDKPQFNHNGGTLLFGPDDGNLYISLGDGGGANDVGLGHVEDWYADNGGGNGQDMTAEPARQHPADRRRQRAPVRDPARQPVRRGARACDEIWAYGFRNPYRMSFDMGGDHELFVGDVGQELWEEVEHRHPRRQLRLERQGGHALLRRREPDRVRRPPAPTSSAQGTRERRPAARPDHRVPARRAAGGPGVAVVGGHRLPRLALPQFRGRYIFGDWSRSFGQPDGSLFVAKPRKRGLWKMQRAARCHQPERPPEHPRARLR